MKSMISSLRALAVVAALGGLSSSVLASGEGWMTDWEAAKKKAAEEKKDLLVDFTGSDWCGWCIKLDKEVFSEAKFKDEASKQFVFVSLDFPQKKELPKEEKEQNEKLQKEFGVQGFPTIFLTDASGKPFGKTGYQPGGPEKYLEHLAVFTTAKATRDKEFAAAEGASGIEKAKHLKAGLDALDPELTDTFYEDTVTKITELDKEDTLGLKKAKEERQLVENLQGDVMSLARAQKREEIGKKIDDFIAEHKLAGSVKQQALMMKFMALGREDMETADKLADEVIAIDGKTKEADTARRIKTQIEGMKKAEAAKKAAGEGEKKAE